MLTMRLLRWRWLLPCIFFSLNIGRCAAFAPRTSSHTVLSRVLASKDKEGDAGSIFSLAGSWSLKTTFEDAPREASEKSMLISLASGGTWRTLEGADQQSNGKWEVHDGDEITLCRWVRAMGAGRGGGGQSISQ